ncbi:ubiquitin domain-containing protein 7SL RNA1-like [Arachis stenosperma]|uniref:ubiquitin domain-containing protein 7SL RNA1-like n=1 Tax=Arachis stenosperma TaxID=217475 RepID=UPI0025AD7433|nr:ubiquitin domain-containing protein 7SL RNA1-like [Arachis stenosperma]
MDVYFDIQRGRTFCIEIGYFDSVLEIKEKVHKYQGIPVAKQTLFFNGHILQDDGDVWKYDILNNSHIQLVVADSDKSPVAGMIKIEDVSAIRSDLSPTVIKVHLNLKIASFKAHVPVEMNVTDSVLKLKEKIQEMEGVSTNKILLHAIGIELHDHQLLKDCDISDKSEIDVSLRPSPTTSAVASSRGSGSGSASKKLKLMVLPNTETNKIPVEVNASDNVRELRKELQKLHQNLQFHLPQEDYFFIYKQNVMDDNMSFRSHDVVQGDTIEIFNGSVTGGS